MAFGGILVTSASAAPNFLVTVSKDNGIVLVQGVTGPVKVEVLRKGVQVGLAEGTAVGSSFDVNQESAPTECWDGFTPEILPGDEVVVTNGDLVDRVPVADIEITDGPKIVNGVGTIKGEVVGARPDLADIRVEARSESPQDFRAFASGAGPESSDPAGVTGTLAYDDDTGGAFTATFEGFTDPQQRIAFLSSFETTATLTTAGDSPTNSNATMAVRADIAAGPDGCPGRARNAVTILGEGSINGSNQGWPFAISGVSNGATEVTVTVTDSKGTVQTAPTAIPQGTALGQTWQTSLPAGSLTGLADGPLKVAATYTVAGTPIRGAMRKIRKDTSAPDAPTISPTGGEFTGSRQIDISSAPGSDIVYTLSGSNPGLLNGVPFRRTITLSESATLRAVAIDAFGNISPVAQASFTALTPPAPEAPQAPGAPGAPGAPTVAKAPGAPKIRTASSGAPGGRVTAIARWAAPAEDGGSDVTRYAVTILRIVDGKVVSRKVVTVSSKARSAKLTLRRGTYKFQVKAMNAAGPGPSSARSNTVRAR